MILSLFLLGCASPSTPTPTPQISIFLPPTSAPTSAVPSPLTSALGTCSSPEPAALSAANMAAQHGVYPFKDITTQPLTNDCAYATVRVNVKFKPSAQSDWIEYYADVEIRNIGGEWKVVAQNIHFVPTQPTPVPTSVDQDQVWAVVLAEAAASKKGNVDQALSLYTDTAVITDTASGTQWIGLDQIRQRYVDIFKQYQFLENNDVLADFQHSNITATVTLTQTGRVKDLNSSNVFDTPPNREVWNFTDLDGVWKIAGFAYFVPLPSSSATAYYNLIMRHSKKCLGIDGGLAAEVGCSPNSQIWNPVSATTNPNYTQLKIQNSNTCLAASSTMVTDPFVLKNCNGDDSVLWQKKPSGGYFQLVNKTILTKEQTNICVDAEMFGTYTIIQWMCKPYLDDDQLDNQLFCQTIGTTPDCALPIGVYVVNIQPDPKRDPEKLQYHVFFHVTFNNTGSQQNYPWFVKTYGQDGAQTPEQAVPIPPGISTITVGPWNIGPACGRNFVAKVFRRRITETTNTLLVMTGPDASEYSMSFKVCQ